MAVYQLYQHQSRTLKPVSPSCNIQKFRKFFLGHFRVSTQTFGLKKLEKQPKLRLIYVKLHHANQDLEPDLVKAETFQMAEQILLAKFQPKNGILPINP